MGQETMPEVASAGERERAIAGGYVIGVDIGGTNLRVALADDAGIVVGKWSSSTIGASAPDAVVHRIREGVDELLEQASLPRESIVAMAAGAPGVTDADRGIVIATSYLMGWRDVRLRELLEDEFGVPVSIENDVNLAAHGEASSGAARGTSDFVFLAVGTGVGAGIVINGQVYRGSIWTAGEIGYMLVPGTPEEPVERGKPGALESLAGGDGIRSQWRRRWSSYRTVLPKEATATEIFDHAVEGNAGAQEVLQLAARTLAYAIYNMSLILNCPLFVLGGTVGLHPALGEAVQRVFDELGARVQPKLIRSALGGDAQLTGAIYLAIDTAKKRPMISVR
jgi:glucokinase